MEWPRTTLASKAGVRPGYGLGIFSTMTLPYHVLGHNGGIDGFLSAYGYSPSRDVGYVVLINSTHAPEALTRLSSLAIRYLKRDVEPPPKPSYWRPRATSCAQYEGYYRDSSPRNEILRRRAVPPRRADDRLDGDHLVLTPDFGPAMPLIAGRIPACSGARASSTRRWRSPPVRAAAPVLTGPGVYAERQARWPVAPLRAGLAAVVIVALLPRWWRSAGGSAAAASGPTCVGVRRARARCGWRRRRPSCSAWRHRGAGQPSPTALGQGDAALGDAVRRHDGISASLAAIGVIGDRMGLAPRPPRRAYAALAALVAARPRGDHGYLAWCGWLAFRSWTY